MADLIYTAAKEALLAGDLSFDGDTLKVVLVNTSYTADPDHTFESDILASELSGTGYADGWGGAGRKTVAGAAVVADAVNNRAAVTGDDVVWAALDAGTIGGAVLVREGASDDTDTLAIAFYDLADTLTVGTETTIAWNSEGLVRLG